MSEIRSCNTDIPPENWNRIFGKEEKVIKYTCDCCESRVDEDTYCITSIELQPGTDLAGNPNFDSKWLRLGFCPDCADDVAGIVLDYIQHRKQEAK